MLVSSKLYEKIKRTFPIPCVDLVVENSKGEILLLKRNDEPAKGEWWFPGGRVFHGEKRAEAVVRKLYDECSLIANGVKEIGTYDLFFGVQEKGELLHSITTVFAVVVQKDKVELDGRSLNFKWRSKENWLKDKSIEREFIARIINELKA